MSDEDLYSILGVLPDAEDIVITAAYRALAQRYHPDKWRGDPDVSRTRMSAINHAYAVLGDKARRAEYDKARSKSQYANFETDTDQDQDEAFADALSDTEERWKVACSIYPDLAEYRTRLSKISTNLAFQYVTTLLDSKSYNDRAKMAVKMERKFLERYFGSNPWILDYARLLILERHKAAARALNRLVDVMGSNVDPGRLIDRIDADFGLDESRQRKAAEARSRDEMYEFKALVKKHGSILQATLLAQRLGYGITEISNGFFSSARVSVLTPEKTTLEFKDSNAFVSWVQKNLC